MKDHWLAGSIIFSTSSLALCNMSLAQEPNCHEIGAMAAMARANSSTVLMTWKPRAGDSYRAQVVFATRSFELHLADRRAASAVLDLIPKNDEQDSVWKSFGDSLCDAETLKDMFALGRIGDHLPHDLARAVLLAPSKMFDYVSYAITSTQDPHSDYAIQMQTVCRARHQEFVNAVSKLPPDDRSWFVSNKFNPDGCRPLDFPEQ
jgi:hypothetical protein